MQKPIKVLIVDNSSIAQEITDALYDKPVARVTLLGTATEGLRMAESEIFELVCVACNLTDMTAEFFCCQLRTLQGYEHATIILFAGESDLVVLKEAMHFGATDVVNKSNLGQLRQYLDRHIERLTRNLIGRVLLVDDSRNQQALIQKFLEQMGLEVDVCESAQVAWKAINDEERSYDLVITDTILDGDMSGVALIREMRNNLSEAVETPVLAMSAIDEKSRRIELLHLGVNDYILKPIIQEELQARVGNLIENRRMLLEIIEQRRMLEQMALIDPVTKLYNRNAFNDIGPKQFEAASRNNIPMCLVVVDIDHFKQVNDMYGHIKGDDVLSEMGNCLKNYVRRGDLVFRWGGEEFVLLLACTIETGAVLVEKIRYKIANTEFARISITASFGISYAEPKQPVNLNIIFDQADKALLNAKRSGRDRVCVFSADVELSA